MQYQTILLSVYAVATFDMVSETCFRRKILQAGIVKLVRLDPLGRRIGPRPRMRFVFPEMHITASDRFVMHLYVTGDRSDHLICAPLKLDAA